jgi:hypothetical protein
MSNPREGFDVGADPGLHALNLPFQVLDLHKQHLETTLNGFRQRSGQVKTLGCRRVVC